MKTCITFGGGAANFKEACIRLVGQAESMGVFDRVKMYTDDDLKALPDFWEKHSDFIQRNPRGYGYWLWKPYLIKKTMKNMKDGDTLMYLDCGCEIDLRKKDLMKQYFEYSKTQNIIIEPNCLEFDWTKMDLVLKLGMLENRYLYTPQFQAGAIMFCVNDKTRKLVDEWYELGCDYHLIDDSPSIAENLQGFQEHRHDQSIFSLLVKKYGFGGSLRITDIVEYERNNSGTSKLEPAFVISNGRP
jgi:hypothetical protein